MPESLPGRAVPVALAWCSGQVCAELGGWETLRFWSGFEWNRTLE